MATEVRRRGRRRSLSPEAIASTALSIVDAEGLGALSMQRLAADLGVGTMTLYGYFRSKDELLDAVVDAAVGHPRAMPPQESWREELRLVVTGVHRTLARHPALVELRLRRPVVRAEALRFGEHALGVLLRAGFEPAAAATAFRLLFTYVFGHAALSAERTAAAARADTLRAVNQLPRDEFPNLTGHAEAFSVAVAGDEQFAAGLELVLTGIEAGLNGSVSA